MSWKPFTGQPVPKPQRKNKAAQELGKLGGKARAASLSPEQLQEIARQGAAKRWQDKAPSMSKAAIYQRNRRAKEK